MSFKCVILLFACCLSAYAAAVPFDLQQDDAYLLRDGSYLAETPTLLVRQVRSPDKGSLDITYSKDQSGRTASAQYNHNLYSSDNGRFRVDANAHASRNFDQNRNNYGAGVQGTYRF